MKDLNITNEEQIDKDLSEAGRLHSQEAVRQRQATFLAIASVTVSALLFPETTSMGPALVFAALTAIVDRVQVSYNVLGAFNILMRRRKKQRERVMEVYEKHIQVNRKLHLASAILGTLTAVAGFIGIIVGG